MKTLLEWLDSLDSATIQWIDYASDDGDYSGRISLSSLREHGAAILPPVSLSLKAGKARFHHAPEVSPGPDPARATAQALVTMTTAMRDLSAQVVTQSRLAVQFQQDSARAHIELLGVHNDFVREHAEFILGSASDLGAHAASVAAQARGDSGIKEVVKGIGEVWAQYLLGAAKDPNPVPAPDFSASEIEQLRVALESQNAPPDLLAALPGGAAMGEALRAIFGPHKEWLMANAVKVAANLPRDLVMRLRALT